MAEQFEVITHENVGDVVHECDISEFGKLYEPKGTSRVTDAPAVRPADAEKDNEY